MAAFTNADREIGVFGVVTIEVGYREILRAPNHVQVYSCAGRNPQPKRVGDREKGGKTDMNWMTKLVLGILTALAMLVLTFALPKSTAVQTAQLVQFPLTVGVWAIFVLLFVKLK